MRISSIPCTKYKGEFRKMLNTGDILETIKMIQEENLDIRTITMGISLLDCIDGDIDAACGKSTKR